MPSKSIYSKTSLSTLIQSTNNRLIEVATMAIALEGLHI